MIPLLTAAAPILGAGISGLFNWFGGERQAEAQSAANETNIMLANQSRAFNAAMWEAQRDEGRLQRADNERLQREFAQHGIQWRVADARAAGVSPLAALGGTGASFSPTVAVPGAAPDTPARVDPVDGRARAMAAMGQDISRAITATADAEKRSSAFTAGMQTLALEKGRLEVELLRSQIGRLRQGQVGPPMPTGGRWMVDGQEPTTKTSGGLINEKAMERTPGDPGNLHREPGSITDVGHARTAGNTYYPVPSENVKERIEDNFWHETMHFIRNNIAPMFSEKWRKPPFEAKQGHQWGFNPFVGYEQYPTRFHERFTGRR